MTVEVTADKLPTRSSSPPTSSSSESLTNARKYADAGAVQVRVSPVADVLLVEVADDGRGGADPASGTGLLGLADRVDALGGTARGRQPARRGTRVSARLPLAQLN